MSGDWVEELFIGKSDMFLVMMNAMWSVAPRQAAAIDRIIRKYFPDAQKVLDLMCGNGRISIHLAVMGYEVVGLDFCEKFIKDARKRAAEYGVKSKTRFIVGDARRVDTYFKEDEFDVVLNFWTSIGYYGDETDRDIFRRVRRITKPNGLFLILNAVSRDAYAGGLKPRTYEVIGENLFLYEHEFDVLTSTHKWRWMWYRYEGRDLRFVDEAALELRVYAIHEVVRMLRDAEWEIVDILHDIETMEKARIGSPINIIAKK